MGNLDQLPRCQTHLSASPAASQLMGPEGRGPVGSPSYRRGSGGPGGLREPPPPPPRQGHQGFRSRLPGNGRPERIGHLGTY